MNNILRYKNIIVAVIIVIVFFILIRNRWSKYSQEVKSLKAKEVQLQKGKETIDKWNKLSREYVQKRRAFLEKETSAFKKYIEENAQRSGVDISSLKVSNADKGFYWESRMNFNAVCSYPDLVKFTRAFEEKNIGVESIAITRSGGGISITAALKGFVLK